jgi:hypothetical protein
MSYAGKTRARDGAEKGAIARPTEKERQPEGRLPVPLYRGFSSNFSWQDDTSPYTDVNLDFEVSASRFGLAKFLSVNTFKKRWVPTFSVFW